MALTLNSTIHFLSGQSLSVVETIAQIFSLCPQAVWPQGSAVTLTIANGDKLWVALANVQWIEPK